MHSCVQAFANPDLQTEILAHIDSLCFDTWSAHLFLEFPLENDLAGLGCDLYEPLLDVHHKISRTRPLHRQKLRIISHG